MKNLTTMKKFIIAAIGIIAVIIGFQIFQSITVRYLSDSGYAVTQDEITKQLTRTGEENESVQAYPFAAGDEVTKNPFGMYIGAKMAPLIQEYPLFVNNGVSLLMLNNSAYLIENNFDIAETYQNLYLSDGYTFNEDRSQADLVRFIFLGLDNKLHINASIMTIMSNIGNIDVKMNSVINFQENKISYCSLENGEFVFYQTTAIDSQTKIKIGDNIYTYAQLLEGLSLAEKNNITHNNPGAIPDITQPEIPQETPTPTPVPVPTSVPVSVPTPKQSADSDVISPSPDLAPSPSPKHSEGPGGEDAPYDPNYFELPKITFEELITDVYSVSSKITIEDLYAKIYKGVKLEFYLDDQLYMRKVLNRTQNFTVSPLKPNTVYNVIAWYDYFDEFNVKTRVTCFKETIKTLGINTLPKTSLSFNNGNIFYNKINIKNIQFNDYENTKRTVTNIATMKIDVGIYPFNLSGSELSKLKTGNTAEFISGAILTSNWEYNFSFSIYDLFGNELPLENTRGQVHTCYYPPEANMIITKNEVSDVRIKTSIKNPDNIDLPNLKFILYDMDNNIVPCIFEGESVPAAEHMISKNGEEIKITSLHTQAGYTAQIISDYDLNDDNGMQYSVVLGKTKFTTLSIASLGYVMLDGNITGITDTSAVVNVNLDTQRTDKLLTFLINEIKIDIIKTSDKQIMRSITVTDEALDAVKNKGNYTGENFIVSSGKIVYGLDALNSATDYTVNITAKASQGGQVLNVGTVIPSSLRAFKTLKKEPIVIVSNAFTSSNIIEMYDVCIEDLNGAILSTVGVQLKNAAGRVLSVKEISVNTRYDRVTFDKLEADQTYIITFIAGEYNNGYTTMTYQSLYPINRADGQGTTYTFTTNESLTGSLQLLQMSEVDPFTGVDIMQNLYDPATSTVGYINTANGAVIVNASYFCSDYIPVSPGYVYSIYGHITVNSNCTAAFYNFDKQYISAQSPATAYTYGNFTAPANAQYMRVTGLTADTQHLVVRQNAANDATHYNAKLKVYLKDSVELMSGGLRYSIKMYVNGDLKETTPYQSENSMVDLIINKSIPASSLAKPDNYRFELWVDVYGYPLMISDVSFDSGQRIYPIRNQADLRGIFCNLNAKYLALNDVVLDTYGTTFTYGNTTFNGVLDFNGYSLTLSSSNTYLFFNIGARATVQNLVLNVSNRKLLNSESFFVRSNYGTMQNIIVNLDGFNTVTEAENIPGYFGALARYNSNSGVIQNFAVNLNNKDYYVALNTAFVVSENAGTVRNGYVSEGTILPQGRSTDSHIQCIGAVVGYNYQNIGVVENVFSLADIKYEFDYTQAGFGSQGTIVGLGYGTVRNSFTVADTWDLRKTKPTYGQILTTQGPGTGTVAVRNNSYSYYVSSAIYSSPYSMKIPKQTLYDSRWYDYLFNAKSGNFVTDPVVAGYYPKVSMPSCMPDQELIRLPEITEADIIQMTSAIVTEQHDDYAIVEFSFNNTAQVKIRSVIVEDYGLIVQLLSQRDIDGISRVTARVTLPSSGAKYLSKYRIMSFSRESGIPGNYVTVDMSDYPRYLNAEFYMPIKSEADWTSIVDMNQNYRLTRNLDFGGVAVKQIAITKSSANFYGKIDGRNFTISNLNFEPTAETYPYLINNLYGTVKNLKIENVNLMRPGNSYSALIYAVQNTGFVENVHVNNIRLTSYNYAGGIAAYVSSGTILNSSASNITIISTRRRNAADTIMYGGIVGYNLYGYISNCYSQNLKISVSDAYAAYVGGIAGQSYQANITNVYAVGRIDTILPNAGGIVGLIANASPYGNVNNAWANVQISTFADTAGGIIGYIPGSIDSLTGCLSLGSLCTKKSENDTISRFVGTGVPTDANICNSNYAFSRQKINGDFPGSLMGTNGILNYSDLKNETTYTYYLNWDNNFDYSEITNGFLPKLKSSEDGKLLPNQIDNLFEDVKIQVDSVETNFVNGEFIVNVEINHDRGIEINSLQFDYLDFHVDHIINNETNSILEYRGTTDDFTRAYDNYLLISLKYTDNGSGEQEWGLFEKVQFQAPTYHDIYNVQDWQDIMAEYGYGYENFRILGNLDFAGYNNTVVSGVKLGRVEGVGTKIIVSNLNLSTSVVNETISFIDSQMGPISNFIFKNCNITKNSTGNARIGIFGSVYGSMINVDFDQITVSGNNATQVGMTGYSYGNVLNNIKLTNITVSGSTYTGGFIGYAERCKVGNIDVIGTNAFNDAAPADIRGISSYNGAVVGYALNTLPFSAESVINVKNLKLQGGNYTGGVFGEFNPDQSTASTFKSINVDGCDISGITYVGGVLGFRRTLNSTVMNSKIQGSGDYTGGVIGHSSTHTANMCNNNKSINNIIISNNYAGGLYGYMYQSAPTIPAESKDNLIIANGLYAGGASAHAWSNAANATSTNNKIFASAYAGGLIGNLGVGSSGGRAIDCYISSTHDPSFNGILTTGDSSNPLSIEVTQVPITDPSTQNRGFGGAYGSAVGGNNTTYTDVDIGVINCVVGAQDADHVGGFLGEHPHNTNFNQIYNSFVQDTTVRGRNYVGGFAGSLRGSTINTLYNCYSNATVLATGDYVGGLTGYFNMVTSITNIYPSGQPQPNAGIYNCMYTGQISGRDYVGGLIGASSLPLNPENVYSNFVAADISATGINVSYTTNCEGTMGTSFVHAGSMINGVSISNLSGTATYSLVGGRLPNGLTLNSNGTITGTPTEAGTFDYTVEITHPFGRAETKNLSITIANEESLELRSLPDGTIDYIDFERGKLVRTVGKAVFTGNENWLFRVNTDTNYVSLYIDVANFNVRFPAIITPSTNRGFSANGFTYGNGGQSSYPNRVGNLIYGYSDASAAFMITAEKTFVDNPQNATDFKNYLAKKYSEGDPIIMLYPLAIPTVEEGIGMVGHAYSQSLYSLAKTDNNIELISYNDLTSPSYKVGDGNTTANRVFFLQRTTVAAVTRPGMGLPTGTWVNATALYPDDYLKYLPILHASNVPYATQTGIRIPDWVGDVPVAAGSFAGIGAMFNMPIIENLPQPELYTVSGDKLNIEFSAINPTQEFVILNGDEEILRQSIDSRVFTLEYDFITPLKLIITDGFFEKEIDINPDELCKKLALLKKEYYFIAPNGIHTSNGVISGDFVNIAGDCAVSADGMVYGLESGQIIKDNITIKLLEEVTPLFDTVYSGNNLKTYKAFTMIGANSQEYQMIAKSGKLFALDPQINYSGIISDVYQGEEYLTVLLNDGKLADLQDKITVPDEFKNSDIVEISDTVNSELPYVFVRYANGNIVAFDYHTGELLSLDYVNEDLSIFDFAIDFFSEKIDINGISEGYNQVIDLKNKLTDGTGIFNEESFSEFTNGENDFEKDRLAINGSSDTNANSVSDGNSTVNANSYANGTTMKNTDEKMQSSRANNIIPVLNVKTGNYELFEESELLYNKKPVSVNEKLKKDNIIRNYSNTAAHIKITTNSKTIINTSGLIIMGFIAVFIIIMLTLLIFKRKRV